MSNISQNGTYRGTVIDRGLSKSSGGHLQLEVSLQATERYNEEAQVWEPFNYEDSEAQAYLNLITGKEKANPVNAKQIMRAFGWDGVSFAALNDMDSGLAQQIQFRMGMETYNDVERCKVQSIAAYDAAPGRQVEKLDAAAVRALDAQYASILRELGGGPKPKTARPAAPPKGADPTLPAAAVAAPTAPTALPAPTEPAKTKSKAKKPSMPPAPPAAAAQPMTQAEAWDMYTTKAEGKTDLEIQNAWIATVKESFGGDEKVGDNWQPVMIEALSRLSL